MNTNDNNINDFAESNYGRLKSQEADFSKGIALYMEDVSVWFDKYRALNNLSLYIKEGELRCIIGPNGAGKTTLMDVITGKTRPTEGSVYFGQTHNLASMTTEQIAEAWKTYCLPHPKTSESKKACLASLTRMPKMPLTRL